MPKTRGPYPPEFRRQIIELARAGRSVAELANEFEPSYWTIRQWVADQSMPRPSLNKFRTTPCTDKKRRA